MDQGNVAGMTAEGTYMAATSHVDTSGQEAMQMAETMELNRPRILLMGLRRSGKSSIQKVHATRALIFLLMAVCIGKCMDAFESVVFHKMSPNQTLFLESTSKVVKDTISNSSFVQFAIWDMPGQIDYLDNVFDSEMIFSGCGALVFVIDAQDDYIEALSKLYLTITRAYKVNPSITFQVFIHKVDGLSLDHISETQRDIQQRTMDELADAGLDNIHLNFYLTSIYDHTIFEAFSRVVQKLIPEHPTLENLLNILTSNSLIEKTFLFDVISKIYIATDNSPVDMQTYELCSDMIDVIVDISCIYGIPTDEAMTEQSTPDSLSNSATAIEEATSTIRLSNGLLLYYREVNRYLALVCLFRQEDFEKYGLIDYNFQCFKKAIQEVYQVKTRMALAGNPTVTSQSETMDSTPFTL